jgi:hypothetical protein
MNDKLVTRDVILDLLPLYLADEASEDTRQLVEAFLATDTKLARLAGQAAVRPLAKEGVAMTDLDNQLDTLLDDVDHQLDPHMLQEKQNMNSFQRTKRLLFQQNLFLALAIFFTLLFTAFGFNEDEIYWVWANTPQLGWIIFVVSGLFWTAFLNVNYQLRLKS